MLESLTLPAVNRLLRANGWALDKLRPHARKVAVVSCPPFRVRVMVTPDGELARVSGDAAPDVTIEVTPGLMMRAAARDATAWRDAKVTGDVELAGAIDYVARNLTWDFEEDLSRVVGDVAAHRIGTAARQLDRWGRDAAMNLAHAAAEYVTFESPLLASAGELERFNREVDTLRDDAERFEKRLALLALRVADQAR
jgi:ubiquinone biosynthesis protein UbiJ